MATDPQVKVSLTLDSKQYEQALKSASKHTAAVDDSIKKAQRSAGRAKADWAAMGAAITVAGGVAVAAMKKAVDAASNLNESTTKMRVIFGAASKDIEKFAATSAESLGMSKQAAYDAASSMAAFGKAAGLTGGDLTKFSTDMVSLSADLASFYNTSPEDAMAAIGAAMRGEQEPIRRYSVLLDDATLRNRALEMGIIANVKNALTPQQKALAAQAEILAQTSDAQGDFARTGDGFANSQRKMQAAMTDAQAALGEALLPAMTKGVKVVTALAEGFAKLPSPVRDTAAGLAATAAAVALLAPAATATVKGVRLLSDGIKAYTTTTTTATVATDALTVSSGRLAGAGGLAAIAKTLGIVGVGVVALGGIIKVAGDQIDDLANRRVNGMVAQLKDAEAAGKALGSTLTVTFGGGEVATGLDQIAAASARSATKAKEAGPAWQALDAYLVGLPLAEAKAKHDELAAAVGAVGMTTQQLNGLLPGYVQGQRDAARAAAEQGESEQAKAEAIKKANDAQQAAMNLLTGYISAQLAAAGAADALLGAQDRLARAHKANGDALTGVSAKAVANREAIRSEMGLVLANAQAKIDAAKASGADTVAAYEIGNKAIKDGKKALIEAAVAAGYSKDEVKALIKQYTLVPPEVETKVQATGVTAAEDAIKEYKRQLDLVPEWKTTHVKTIFDRYNQPGKAGGGKITGPGTGTSDTAGLYALSNGEWVIPAASARRAGDGFMAALVAGDLDGMATGGKVKKPLTAAQRKAKAKAAAAKRAAARKKAAQAAADRRQEILDDIEWQYDMGFISLDTKIGLHEEQLGKLKPGSAEAKDLQLAIKREKDDQAQKVADELTKAAEAQQKAAEDQQAAADALKDKASSIADSITNSLGLGQTQANGKRWTTSAMLGDFANRAQKAQEFATMVADLARRGLSEDVIQQVLAAGPEAGADMARALTRMSDQQIAQVNASQASINASGQALGNALVYGGALPYAQQTLTVEMSGGAPVVLQLDSRAIYEGQLQLKRQMGGTYALTGA